MDGWIIIIIVIILKIYWTGNKNSVYNLVSWPPLPEWHSCPSFTSSPVIVYNSMFTWAMISDRIAHSNVNHGLSARSTCAWVCMKRCRSTAVNPPMSFIRTSRWRERAEEDDHHRCDSVLQSHGPGMPERCNVQQDYDKITYLMMKLIRI